MEKKRCARCGKVKPHNQFAKNRARYDGLSGYCRPCQNEETAKNYQRVRAEVILLLGGPVCARCGFDDPRVLIIDHKDGGGTQHRRDAVSGYSILKHAMKYPEQYQVLCWNCNHIKRHEEGEWASKEYLDRIKDLQREKVTASLRWARDHDVCTHCGTTSIPHKGKGLCRNCFAREYRTGSVEKKDVSALRSQAMKDRWADPKERKRLLESKERS